MKLSDIKGERAIEVIAEIIDPIANIATDKEARLLFQREKLPEGVSAEDFVIGRIRNGLPKLLSSHKHDIISILAAIEGVSAKEYSETLDILKLMRDCTELLNDPSFKMLFFSAQSGTSSGSAPENTEAQNQ